MPPFSESTQSSRFPQLVHVLGDHLAGLGRVLGSDLVDPLAERLRRDGAVVAYFAQLLDEASQAQSWRSVPSSRFRWMALSILSADIRGMPSSFRYYKTKQLAETWAKATFRMYAVGKVKGQV